ncbi:hypothetical protein [Streptomyces sp. NPDC001205]
MSGFVVTMAAGLPPPAARQLPVGAGSRHLVVGKGGLIPPASTLGGAYPFLLPRPGNTPVLAVHVGDDDNFNEYDMTFAVAVTSFIGLWH